MSLVWPETVDVYLSQRLALVQKGESGPVSVHYSPTLPLASVLERVAIAALQGKGRTRLRVTLSAALAPPIAYRLPKEVTQWRERIEFVRATAARTLSIPATFLESAIDPSSTGISVSVGTQVLGQLHLWASQLGTRIISIQPLWSIATQCGAASAASVDGVLINEPDGVCSVVPRVRDGSPFAQVIGLQDSRPRGQIAESLSPAGVDSDRVLNLSFGPAQGEVAPGLPKRWIRHWRYS